MIYRNKLIPKFPEFCMARPVTYSAMIIPTSTISLWKDDGGIPLGRMLNIRAFV